MSWQLTLGAALALVSVLGAGGLYFIGRRAVSAFWGSWNRFATDKGRAEEKKDQAAANEKQAIETAKEIAAQRDLALRPPGGVDDAAGWLSGQEESRRKP